MYLSADQILGADDLPTEEVPVPEWAPEGTDPDDAFVLVRGLTGAERDSFEFRIQEARKDPSKVKVRAEIVGRCIVNADGEREFSDRQIDALGEKSGVVLDRVFDVVRVLSGMKEQSAEEAAEDFGSAPDGGSPSD